MENEPIKKVDVHTLVKEAKSGTNLVTVEGTVDTGFEFLALDECKEVFGTNISACKGRGRVFFNIPLDYFLEIKNLRSIDNLFLVVDTITDFHFDKESKEEDLNKLKELANKLDLKWSLEVWKTYVNYFGITSPTMEQFLKAEEIRKILKAKAENKTENNEDKSELKDTDNKLNDVLKVLKFRATCNRTGKHEFTSMDAARDFGGQMQDKHHWLVDLSNYDLDVVLNIDDNQGYVCFGLTKESLHRRNITHFGPTTLRATHCYNMLRMTQLKVGDIVVDPLCGGGSIPIEGALAFPNAFYIGGDIHEKAVNRSEMNYTHICSTKGSPIPLDIFRWDIGKLPLRSSSVDVFATDLPFGKRSGRRMDNRPLYTKVLKEMARVVRPKTGRAVLLTHDRKTFIKVLSAMTMYWGHGWRPFNINLGGLEGGVFLLKRSERSYVQ